MRKEKHRSMLISYNWSDKLEDILGKFVVAPTPHAEQMFDLIDANPDMYCIESSYMIEPETGKKEIVGMSFVTKGKDEIRLPHRLPSPTLPDM